MPNYDADKFEARLDRLVDVFGPNIRELLPAINQADDDLLQKRVDGYIGRISQALENLDHKSIEQLFKYRDAISSSSSAQFTHTLVHTYGCASGIPYVDEVQNRIRSPLILRLLLRLMQLRRLSTLREMHQVLSAASHLAVSRGWAFEILCHEKLCKIESFVINPMVKKGHTLIPDTGNGINITMGPRRLEIYSVSTRVEQTTCSRCYYVPAEGNNPTFDAFAPGPESMAFQMFIARKHSFKKKGADMVRKRLQAFDTKRDFQISKVKFVFVVPSGTSFQVEAPNWRDKTLSEIDFYVLELDIGSSCMCCLRSFFA